MTRTVFILIGILYYIVSMFIIVLVLNLINRKNINQHGGKIEDFFKICKEGLSMKNIHKYTIDSIFKHVILNVFLAGLITSLGYNTKTDLQKLSEHWKFKDPK